MMMVATDWTYDLFTEDAQQFKATPMKGVHCQSNAGEREQFMVWFKNAARDFKAEWLESHTGLYETYEGWCGDAFANEIMKYGCFSDFYKDAYGQRPHLPYWFYVQATGLPTGEDVVRTFCASPVEDAVGMAKRVRESF